MGGEGGEKKDNIFSKAVQMLQVNYKLHGNCYNTAECITALRDKHF